MTKTIIGLLVRILEERSMVLMCFGLTLFLEGQISLLAETTQLTDEILRREKHVDMLFLSASFCPSLGAKVCRIS